MTSGIQWGGGGRGGGGVRQNVTKRDAKWKGGRLYKIFDVTQSQIQMQCLFSVKTERRARCVVL